MTRHVANGGRPHDEFGEHIIKTSEDIAKLNSFSRYVANKDQLNDNAGDIIEQTKLTLENLRSYMKNLSKQSHYESASKDFKTADEVVLDDETANSYKDKFTMKNFDSRVEEALPLIHKIMSELEASDVVTVGKGTKNLEVVQAEYEILGTMEDMMAEGDSEQEVMEKIANFVKDEAGEDHVDKAMEIIKQAKENNDQEMTFEDMINKLKGKKEDQVNELDPGDEPIDAPIQPPVEHGAVVQSFLNDPDSKLVLRKDDSADKMLKVTKFTNKNTMLSSILSDIASRLLTKSGEEDRVANFASRVADEMEQENSATFKPTPDYMKNKKIAIQLAKRYIDDYKKMEKDPAYEKEVRMEPGEFSPKKDLKGKAKETEAFESWVDSMIDEGGIKPYVSMSRSEATGKMTYNVLDRNEKTIFSSIDQEEAQDFLRKNYDKLRAGEMQVASGGVDTVDMDEYAKEPKDEKDREEKLKALQDIQMDPQTSKDPELMKQMAQRKKELMKQPAMAGEGNQFAQAVQKAKAAGMKAGDKFKVGDKEYTLKDAIEIAGLELNEFYSEEELATEQEIERLKTLSIYQ